MKKLEDIGFLMGYPKRKNKMTSPFYRDWATISLKNGTFGCKVCSKLFCMDPFEYGKKSTARNYRIGNFKTDFVRNSF